MAANKRAASDTEDQVLEERIVKRRRAEVATSEHDDTFSSCGSTPDAATHDSSVLPDYTTIAGSATSNTTLKKPKIFHCTVDGCFKSFDRPARLEIHMRSHTNERPFICEESGCGKAFLRNEHLKAHVKSKHSDERNYVCTYITSTDDSGEKVECRKSFHTAQRLRRHVAAHEEKEQTKCQECGKIFRKQETLQRHIRTEHLAEHAYRCEHVDPEDPSSEVCGQTFATVGQIRAHEIREHSGRKYVCDICQQSETGDEAGEEVSFITYAELQAHIKEAHPPECQECGEVCISKRALKAHMEIVHSTLSSRQRFECEHPGCGRKFTKKGNLQVHIQSVHAKIKPFICGQTDLSNNEKVEGWSGIGCGSTFGTKASLEGHIRTQHLGLPATMKSGGSKLSRKVKQNDLDDSIISSITGHNYEAERPFTCLDYGCDSRFRKEHDLAIHLELHHEWIIDDVNDALAGLRGVEQELNDDSHQRIAARLSTILLEDESMIEEPYQPQADLASSVDFLDPMLVA